MMSALLLGLAATASAAYSTPGAARLQIDRAFSKWQRQQQLSPEARMQRYINRLACPDVPVRLSYEGVPKAAILPGSGTTDVLHRVAARLYALDAQAQLSFSVRGAPIPGGVAISETPLADSTDLEVVVTATPWYQSTGRRATRRTAALIPGTQRAVGRAVVR
jgi:hypothetical protein